MCQFVSWIEYNGEIFFLKNDDLNTKEGKKLLKPEFIKDLSGHGAIRAFYPELQHKGINKECTDFSSPNNFPLKIVKEIKNGNLSRIGLILPQVLNKPAWDAYEKIEQPAWAAYEKIQQPAWAAYEKIEQPAWAAYKKIEQSALAAYEKIEQPALAAYEKIQQDTVWKLFKNPRNRIKEWRQH
uniref:Uncharacterized protein n=1 Tax=viral metagenome TaxID=1070528 RepID=A0A6M3JBC0_9ZZZZ